ncbi:Branched-chain-amino-acid aminotransferase-like protein 2 [Nymphaea thermarum]|nr:Branched-chain-amino-acid aminotransferase-like protein 2 [Nymphaea thermarum]
MLELTSSSADEVREKMEGTVDISHPSAENLFCAFLAMESTDWLLQLARFLPTPFIALIILGVILGILRLSRDILSENCLHKSSLPMSSGKLLVPLKCSLNMLEGDTGYANALLFLPPLLITFSDRRIRELVTIFEVGSGVGLVGICLVHAKASRVILSDGDMLTLSNMRLNLEMNHPVVLSEVEGQMEKVSRCLDCKCFTLFEFVKVSITFLFSQSSVGADVIYDPLCVPHLIRVLAMLLKPRKCSSHQQAPSLCEELDGIDILENSDHTDQFHQEEITCSDSNDLCNETRSFCFSRLNATPSCGESKNQSSCFEFEPSNRSQLDETVDHEISCNGGNMDYERNHSSERKHPVAYIATVIRSKETFEHFLSQAEHARLSVVDITELQPPLCFLPYMHSYDRSCVRLLKLCYSGVISGRASLRDSPSSEDSIMVAQEVEVIHSWSAPRSLSTSLMYSFAQARNLFYRDDMEVLDEPLYAHFLKVTGAERPYRAEVLSNMVSVVLQSVLGNAVILAASLMQDSDGDRVVKEVIFGPGEKKYRYCKHMAKQRLPGLPRDLMGNGKHFILIRNPLHVLPSFDRVVPPSFLELGFADLVSIYSDLCELGKPPPIIDAADLQENPEAALRVLCEDLGIPFQARMLKWEAGPKPMDGVWAPWWYKSVHKSTCFNSRREYPLPFPSEHYDLLEKSLPFYNLLKRPFSKLSPELPSPRLPVPDNEKILVWVGDELLPRDSAKVSVFDSVVQGGDAVWEGLRIYNGKIFKLEEHLDRLFDSAKALAFANVPEREQVKKAIFTTLISNGMLDKAHVRLTLTRGKKVTSGMSPAFNLYGCTLIVLAEWKPPVYDNSSGISLVTATTRRNSPNNLDSKIHHNNLLNNILAKIEGNHAQAADAIMLDQDGFVSETNATNIFLVKKGCVSTPHADYCLPGITRQTVIDLVIKENLDLKERRISLSEFHTADEVWTTGTMGELTPVVSIDGRTIGNGEVGPVTRRLQSAYRSLSAESGVTIPA